MKKQSTLNKLIAISGLKGSGKDLAADMLQYCLSVPKIFRQYFFYRYFKKLIKPKYRKLAFADPLKKMLSSLLNIELEKFYDRDFKENHVIEVSTLNPPHIKLVDECIVFPGKLSDSKFNKLVKQLDPSLTEASLSIRQLLQYFGTEIMQKYFGKRVWINSTLKHAHGNTIISDLRFKAEAEAVKERNGKIIYISRPEHNFGQHASEREMSELLSNNQYDYIIENNGTQEDLFNKIKTLCND